eukprot:12903382-Prorocentrum_lima.AAC.1
MAGSGASSPWPLATTQHTTSHAYVAEGSSRPTGRRSCDMCIPSTCSVVNATHPHVTHVWQRP